MKNLRIIPRLDIKGPNLVKGIHLEGLRIIGKPDYFAKYYYENGADELIYMDIVASLYGRNNILDIVSKTSEEIFIPLTVGGGLRTLEDIHAALRSGADKVAINTAAIKDPDLISAAANRFGSSTIVVSIEAKKKSDGKYEAYIENGREQTGIDAIEWALRAEELGAGEIMITSIDKEGTGLGFDIDLTKKITESVSLPVIACGGAGCVEHVIQVSKEANVDAIAIASLFHYRAKKDLVPELSIKSEPLNMDRGFSRIKDSSIIETKKILSNNNINCRPIEID